MGHGVQSFKWYCAALVFSATASCAFGQVINKIADSTTIIPEGQWTGQPFAGLGSSSFNGGPYLSGDSAVFLGGSGDSGNGVYKQKALGAIHMVVDPSVPPPAASAGDPATLPTLPETNSDGTINTAVPYLQPAPSGGSLPSAATAFTVFRYPSVDGQECAFSSYSNLYRTSNGSLIPIFNSSNPFYASSRPSLDGSNVFFYGQRTSSSEGVYRADSNGFITALAMKGTPMPSSPGFVFETVNSNVAGALGRVAFYGSGGSNSRRGIYEYANGSLRRVADNQMTAPAGGTFVGFSNAYIAHDGSTVVFAASDSVHGNGIFASVDGVLRAIALNGEFAPGGGVYSMISTPELAGDGDHFAFIANANSKTRLFTDLSGTMQPLISTGDFLFGKRVLDLRLSVEGVSGNNIAFYAMFTDGSGGLFTTLPEPAIGMLALAPLILCRRSRRRA